MVITVDKSQEIFLLVFRCTHSESIAFISLCLSLYLHFLLFFSILPSLSVKLSLSSCLILSKKQNSERDRIQWRSRQRLHPSSLARCIYSLCAFFCVFFNLPSAPLSSVSSSVCFCLFCLFGDRALQTPVLSHFCCCCHFICAFLSCLFD